MGKQCRLPLQKFRVDSYSNNELDQQNNEINSFTGTSKNFDVSSLFYTDYGTILKQIDELRQDVDRLDFKTHLE